MSLGKDRVRAGFNPSRDQRVESIKSLTAQLIDVCEDLKLRPQERPAGSTSLPTENDGKRWSEQSRLAALAQTAYEEAAMWAVKAATTGK